MEKFRVYVSGFVPVEVMAFHEEMAQANVEAFLYEKNDKKYGIPAMEGKAILALQAPQVCMYKRKCDRCKETYVLTSLCMVHENGEYKPYCMDCLFIEYKATAKALEDEAIPY